MKDNNVYIKQDNGRYVPFGTRYDEHYLADGLWFVKHTDHSRRITSVPYLASLFHMNPEKVDVNLLCSMEEMSEKVFQSKLFKDLMNRSYSLQELVSTIVKIIYDNNETN